MGSHMGGGWLGMRGNVHDGYCGEEWAGLVGRFIREG